MGTHKRDPAGDTGRTNAGWRWIPLLKSRWTAFAHDLAWVPIAAFLAFWLRFNLGEIPAPETGALLKLMLVSTPMMGAVFWAFGLYRGLWRFASLPDLVRILKAVGAGVALSFALLFAWDRLAHVPRSVLLLFPLCLAMGLAGPRLAYRWWKDHRISLSPRAGKRAVIVGAGRAGELLVRDLLKDDAYLPVAFVDDDPGKQGREIHGVRVAGALADLETLIRRLEADVVLLAIPSAPRRVVREVVAACQRAGVACRTLPSLADLAGGRVEVSRLRKVEIEDLLGREPVQLDLSRIRSLIEEQVVLVTGAGGSIGSELCRQIARHKPRLLLLFDHGEYNLYRIDMELDPSVPRVPVLGDIRDEHRLRWLFETYRPQLVFNAAAYKHVPLVEANPAEGVSVNVLGTCRLADLSVEYGVRKFVQISTDKAVNPTNVMGATKRAAELYCQNLDRRAPATAFITTRFGNVLDSAGSVVPLFREQIARGGPVTVTHPEITRYFMTIPEAVSLILQAAVMGRGGEIFVLDMGEPVRIVDLAEQMIRLSGLEPGRDVEIVFTGLRPGEKLHEELFHESEPLVGTAHPKLLLAGSRELDWEEVRSMLDRLGSACASRDVEALIASLSRMVPEYRPPEPPARIPQGKTLH